MPAASIPESIQQRLEETDTFLILVSESSKKSDYCKNELAYTLGRRKQVNRPKRVVALLVDGTPPPFLLSENLALMGSTRAERELSLIKLMSQEA